MPHARFDIDGHEPLEFSVNPLYPGETFIDSGMVTALTEGGEIYASRKSSRALKLALRFEGMPASDYDGGYDYATGAQDAGTQSLVNWFLNVAPAGALGFNYTDPFGDVHSVTFADGTLDMRLTDEGVYSGTVKLRKALG